MKILVTGASGFIGSAFVRHVLKHYKDFKVRALVRNTNQRNMARLTSFPHVQLAERLGRLELVCGDLLGDISGICEKCDWVVNFAAKTFVDHCYSADTEVLTKRGWILWSDVNESDQISTRNSDGKMEWQKPTKLYASDYEGEMVSIKSRSLDLLVTPNHRMYGAEGRNINKRDQKLVFIPAEKLLTMDKQRLGLPFRIPAWNTWEGTVPFEEFEIEDQYDNLGRKINGGKIPLKTWVSFLGIYIAEGYCSKNAKSGRCVIGVCQNRDSKHFDKIKTLLDSTPWKWQYQGKQFVTCSKTLFAELTKLGKCYDKFVPDWVKELPKEYLELLLDWAVIGDGSLQARKEGSSRRYYTVSEKLANDIQEIILKIGRHATKKPKDNSSSGDILGKKVKSRVKMWQVLERTSDWTPVRNASKIHYKGKVYCAEVPNGVMLVRRNGFVSWCGNSILDSLPFIESNVLGTHRLLEDARRNRVKRYVQISTDEVYGAILKGAYTEDSRLNPTNPYSASKAGADAITISYAHTYGLHTTITRTENNFGFFQNPQKALPVFIKAANEDKLLPIYGDGGHVRQWLWVDDHVTGILTLLQKPDLPPGEVYHVAGSQELTNLELAKKLLRLCGKSEDQIKFVPDHDIRPGHDRRYALVCDKLRALGWEPKVSLDVGLAEAVSWYTENKWWSE